MTQVRRYTIIQMLLYMLLADTFLGNRQTCLAHIQMNKVASDYIASCTSSDLFCWHKRTKYQYYHKVNLSSNTANLAESFHLSRAVACINKSGVGRCFTIMFCSSVCRTEKSFFSKSLHDMIDILFDKSCSHSRV